MSRSRRAGAGDCVRLCARGRILGEALVGISQGYFRAKGVVARLVYGCLAITTRDGRTVHESCRRYSEGYSLLFLRCCNAPPLTRRLARRRLSFVVREVEISPFDACVQRRGASTLSAPAVYPDPFARLPTYTLPHIPAPGELLRSGQIRSIVGCDLRGTLPRGWNAFSALRERLLAPAPNYMPCLPSTPEWKSHVCRCPSLLPTM